MSPSSPFLLWPADGEHQDADATNGDNGARILRALATAELMARLEAKTNEGHEDEVVYGGAAFDERHHGVDFR